MCLMGRSDEKVMSSGGEGEEGTHDGRVGRSVDIVGGKGRFCCERGNGRID